MRIDDLNRAPFTESTPGAQGTNKSETAGNAQSANQDPVGGAEGSDQSDISVLAQSLTAADPSRIEQLRMQVESGTYEVSAASLANALIDAHLSSPGL
jgi:anti-sigma28 factor (negative regulator of flagellin synthesis)